MTGWCAVWSFRTMVPNQMAMGETGVMFPRITEPTVEERAILHAVELNQRALRQDWTGLGA